jgi:hypothetical protein
MKKKRRIYKIKYALSVSVMYKKANIKHTRVNFIYCTLVWRYEWMNECLRGRPSRPLHRDLMVYCASSFSVIPSATPRFESSVGFWTWGRQSSHLVPKSIDPSDVLAGFEPLVRSCLWLRFQQQVHWLQLGPLMVHQMFEGNRRQRMLGKNFRSRAEWDVTPVLIVIYESDKMRFLAYFPLFWKIKGGLCDHLAVHVCEFPINVGMPESVFMKLGMYIMAPSSIPPINKCIPPIVARQRLGKNVTAPTNTHATIELLDASFSIGSCSIKGK